MTWLGMIRSLIPSVLAYLNTFFHDLLGGTWGRAFLFVPMAFVSLSVVSFSFFVIRKVFF